MITTIARINNRTCNLFATHFGLFLHASGVPQRVVNALSQIGLSISQKSIHRTINSLSVESSENIRKAAQSLQYMMVYDNLVLDYNSPVLNPHPSHFQSTFAITWQPVAATIALLLLGVCHHHGATTLPLRTLGGLEELGRLSIFRFQSESRNSSSLWSIRWTGWAAEEKGTTRWPSPH